MRPVDLSKLTVFGELAMWGKENLIEPLDVYQLLFADER